MKQTSLIEGVHVKILMLSAVGGAGISLTKNKPHSLLLYCVVDRERQY